MKDINKCLNSSWLTADVLLNRWIIVEEIGVSFKLKLEESERETALLVNPINTDITLIQMSSLLSIILVSNAIESQTINFIIYKSIDLIPV